MNKNDFEFTATPFKTDVPFSEWFERLRASRGHETWAQTARELGCHRTVPASWVRERRGPRVRHNIIQLAKWSGEPIRLIRGMIEYEHKVRDQAEVAVPQHFQRPAEPPPPDAQPWRATPHGRQQTVIQWIEGQAKFFEAQGGMMKEFALTLRSATQELQKQADATRTVRKEVEVVRPSRLAVEN